MAAPNAVAGRFVIEKAVATGGMGAVYKGKDLQTGGYVAIKVLQIAQADAYERFEREAKLLAELEHPNIVRYVTHGFWAGKHFLVMEWVEGQTLRALGKRVGLALDESISVVRQVASALGAIHQRGLVHRDIKPANIMVLGTGPDQVKLVDFGVARKSQEAIGPTKTGMMVGSPGYMSPEQARGQRHVDARADVFALGCVLYECLTGYAPFTGVDMLAIRANVLVAEPIRPQLVNPGIPDSLATICEEMLSKNPDRRPRDGAAVAALLAAHPPIVGSELVRFQDRPFQRGATREQTSTKAMNEPAGGIRFVMLVGTGDDTESLVPSEDAPDPMTDKIRELARETGATIDHTQDGRMVVVLPFDRSELSAVQRAGTCALALRLLTPGKPMVMVAARRGGEDVGQMINRAAALLASEEMDSLFANAGGGPAVRVDDTSAQHLGPHFSLRTGRHTHLVGPKT